MNHGIPSLGIALALRLTSHVSPTTFTGEFAPCTVAGWLAARQRMIVVALRL